MEPPRPSTRITQLGRTLTEAAKNRHSEPAKLAMRVPPGPLITSMRSTSKPTTVCWLVLLVAGISLAVLLVGARGDKTGNAAGLGKAAEREVAYRARIELINKLYGPVETLIGAGNRQEALLKLDGLIRQYPGEAHGYILQGAILRDMGAADEAVASFVQGIKLNGDYLDDRSPLSRRSEIRKFVDDALKRTGTRIASNPVNRTAAETLQKLSYLRSRLAGGCE